MDEILRCFKVLGVEPGSSLEEVRKAYRDLVQVWHPDRFSNNDRLRLKAEEQLKEINLAYEHLVANAFQDGLPVELFWTEKAASAAAPPEQGSAGFDPAMEEP